MTSENLGEFLTGNRIETSPYAIYMQHNISCSALCLVSLGVPLVVTLVLSARRIGAKSNLAAIQLLCCVGCEKMLVVEKTGVVHPKTKGIQMKHAQHSCWLRSLPDV